MEHRIIYQKKPLVTVEEVIQAFQSKRAEERASVLRYELDYELSVSMKRLQKDAKLIWRSLRNDYKHCELR